MLLLARLIVQELLKHACAATARPRARTTDSDAAKGCFSDWGVGVEPGVANGCAMTLPVQSGTNCFYRSGMPARIVRAPRLAPGAEDAQAAVYAKWAHIRVVAEDPLSFRNQGSRSPSAESRSASDRKILPASHPTTRASDFRWRHRTARQTHEPSCPALALQSEFLPLGATEELAEDRAASEPRRGCRPEPHPARRRKTSWHMIFHGGLTHRLNMLIYQYCVSVWVSNHKAGWTSRVFVCLRNHFHAPIFELAL